VKIWDPSTGQELLTLAGHTRGVRSAAFYPDGTCLATASWDKTVMVWDTTTGRVVATLRGHKQPLWKVAVSPDGQWIASAGGAPGTPEGEVKIWSTATHKQVLALADTSERFVSIAVSPNHPWLAVGGRSKTVTVWDLVTGQLIRTLRGHNETVASLAFSPDGQRLATAAWDGHVKVWNAATGEEQLSFTASASEIFCVVFSPDGQRLATASWDNLVKLWDAGTGDEILTLRGHTSGTRSVTFSPDGQLIATASADGTVRLWQATPLSAEQHLRRQAAKLVNQLVAELAFKDDAAARLRRDTSLSEPLRQQALVVLDRYLEYPTRFWLSSWAVARLPGAAPVKYRLALRQAEAGCRLASPQDELYGSHLNTVGAAQYRLGQYQDALKTLERADATYFKGSVPTNSALLCMVHRALGHKVKAQAYLSQARLSMKNQPWTFNEEAQALVHEAEGLLHEPGKRIAK
jgi:WD40 repeat protein